MITPMQPQQGSNPLEAMGLDLSQLLPLILKSFMGGKQGQEVAGNWGRRVGGSPDSAAGPTFQGSQGAPGLNLQDMLMGGNNMQPGGSSLGGLSSLMQMLMQFMGKGGGR